MSLTAALKYGGCSSGVEHLTVDQVVVGSNPIIHPHSYSVACLSLGKGFGSIRASGGVEGAVPPRRIINVKAERPSTSQVKSNACRDPLQ